MTETEMVRAVVAEMRAADLVAALQAAVAGESHWRLRATVLLREIDEGVLRPGGIDARKRAAEILNDVCADADH